MVAYLIPDNLKRVINSKNQYMSHLPNGRHSIAYHVIEESVGYLTGCRLSLVTLLKSIKEIFFYPRILEILNYPAFFTTTGFRTLEVEDQKTILKSSLIELSLFRLAYRYVYISILDVHCSITF